MKTTLAALAILTLPGCLPNPVPRTMFEPLETTEAGFPETDREVLDPDPGFETGPEFEEVLPETGAPEVVEVLAPPEVSPGEVPPEESEVLAEAPEPDPGPETGEEGEEVPNGQETGSVEASEETSEVEVPEIAATDPGEEPIEVEAEAPRPCDGVDRDQRTCVGTVLETCVNPGQAGEYVVSLDCSTKFGGDGTVAKVCGFDPWSGHKNCIDPTP